MKFVSNVVRVSTKSTPAQPQYPHLAVARGLALAGETMIRAQGFLAAAEELFGSAEFAKAIDRHLPAYINAFAEWLTRDLNDRLVIPAYRKWLTSPGGTLAEVPGMIAKQMVADATTAESQRLLSKALEPWASSTERDLNDLTGPLCRRFGIDDKSLAVPAPYLIEIVGDPAHGTDRAAVNKLIGATISTAMSGTGWTVALLGTSVMKAVSMSAFGGVSMPLLLAVMGVTAAGLGLVYTSPAAKEKMESWITHRELPGTAKALASAGMEKRFAADAEKAERSARQSIVAAFTSTDADSARLRDLFVQEIVAGPRDSDGAGLLAAMRTRAAEVTILLP
jgi:hypothetical protein